jgi:hypothetical protein
MDITIYLLEHIFFCDVAAFIHRELQGPSNHRKILAVSASYLIGIKLKPIKSILIPIVLILCFGCTPKKVNQNLTNSEKTRPGFVKGGALTGTRSRASLMRAIMANIGRFRQLYNEVFKDNYPDYMKVVVFFKINYLGIVTSSLVKETNSNDSEFDSKILELVNSITFETIDKRNDITEVTYPFVFTK